MICNRQKQPTRSAIKMVGANRKVKKVEAADYGLAKPVAYQPIQPNDPHLYSGLGKIQGNAAIVLHKVDFIAATLRHSDPITNTDVSVPLSSQKEFLSFQGDVPTLQTPPPLPGPAVPKGF